MKIAASLAAAIKDHFGIDAKLVEGHNGVFEIAVDRKTIYSNGSKCSVLPETKMVLEVISQNGGKLIKQLLIKDLPGLSLEGAARPMPDMLSEHPQAVTIQKEIGTLNSHNSSISGAGVCGCGSDANKKQEH